MTLVNSYPDANLTLGKLASAALSSGAQKIIAIQAFSVAAADAADHVYRVFPNVPSDAIVTTIKIMNDAVTGATGALIGIYDSLAFDGLGTAIDSNYFHTNFNLSSANAIASNYVDGMPAVPIADRDKQLWEIAAQTQYPGAAGPKASAYDICLTMPNKTTVATGDIVMILEYVRGV